MSKDLMAFTINELLCCDEWTFCEKLYAYTEDLQLDNSLFGEALQEVNAKSKYHITDDDDPINKIRSWIDCLRFLQNQFRDMPSKGLGNVYVVFEYHIGKRWSDAIIVCQDKMIILEFKSGKSNDIYLIQRYERQLDQYYNRIRRGNAVVVQRIKEGHFALEKYLVFTDPSMKGKIQGSSDIIVDDDFYKVCNSISNPANFDTVKQLLDHTKFIDPSISGALSSLIHYGIVNYVEKDNDNVKACDEIRREILAEQVPTLGITLVKGGPGTGKTGTAFTLLEKCLKEGVTKVQYVTGNRNLENYFNGIVQEEVKYHRESANLIGLEEELIGRINDLYDAKKFCNKYHEKENVSVPILADQVLLIDEAQRMWNALNIATRVKRIRGNYESLFTLEEQKFLYKNYLSEAFLLLFSAMQGVQKDHENKNIIMFLGNGQEINNGEEDGETDILNSIYLLQRNITKKQLNLKLKVYVSESDVNQNFKDHNVDSYYNPALKLKSNQRNDVGDPNLSIVNAILDGQTDSISQDGYKVYNDFKALHSILTTDQTDWTPEDESIGIVMDSYEPNYSQRGEYYIAGSYLHEVGKGNKDLYDFYYMRNSNNLTTYVTEFGCQGLEFDESVMVWGNTLLWRNGKWEHNPQKNRYRRISKHVKQVNDLIQKINQDNPNPRQLFNENEVIDQFVTNAYRVLLTRARETTYIYCEDPETYSHLSKLLQ